MRQSIRALLLVATALTVFVVACKGPKFNGTKHIPSTATAVLSIQLQQLIDKGHLDNPDEYALLKRITDEAAKEGFDLAKILKNTEKTGLDFNQPAYAFMEMGDNSHTFTLGLIISVEDADKFQQFSADMELPKFEDKGDYMGYTGTEGEADQGLIGITNSALCIVFSNKDFDKTYAENVILAKHKEDITTQKSFVKSIRPDQDVQFWMNLDPVFAQFGQDMSTVMVLQGLGLTQDDLQNNFLTSQLRFGKHDVSFDINMLLTEAVQNVLFPFFKSTVSSDFASVLPKKDFSGVQVLGLSMEGIHQFLKDRNYAQMADSQLKGAGLSLETVLGAFNGDIAFTNYLPQNLDVSAPDQLPMIFSLAIGEKAKFDKLMSFMPLMAMSMGLEETKTGYKSDDIEVILTDKFVHITTDANCAAQLKNKKNVGLPANITKIISQYPYAGYSSVESLKDFSLMEEAFKEFGDATAFKEMLDVSKEGVFFMKKGHYHATFALNKSKAQKHALRYFLSVLDATWTQMDKADYIEEGTISEPPYEVIEEEEEVEGTGL